MVMEFSGGGGVRCSELQLYLNYRRCQQPSRGRCPSNWWTDTGSRVKRSLTNTACTNNFDWLVHPILRLETSSRNTQSVNQRLDFLHLIATSKILYPNHGFQRYHARYAQEQPRTSASLYEQPCIEYSSTCVRNACIAERSWRIYNEC